jgi:hypothetical protein
MSTDTPIAGDSMATGRPIWHLSALDGGVVGIAVEHQLHHLLAAVGSEHRHSVPGDHDATERSTRGYRPSTGVWASAASSTNYATYGSQTWGFRHTGAGRLRWDGTDLAIYRPSTGVWWILLSNQLHDLRRVARGAAPIRRSSTGPDSWPFDDLIDFTPQHASRQDGFRDAKIVGLTGLLRRGGQACVHCS